MQRIESVSVFGPGRTQILDSSYEVIFVQLFSTILCPMAKLLEIGLNTFPCRSCPDHDIFEQRSTLRLRREPPFYLSYILISLKGVLVWPYDIIKLRKLSQLLRIRSGLRLTTWLLAALYDVRIIFIFFHVIFGFEKADWLSTILFHLPLHVEYVC